MKFVWCDFKGAMCSVDRLQVRRKGTYVWRGRCMYMGLDLGERYAVAVVLSYREPLVGIELPVSVLLGKSNTPFTCRRFVFDTEGSFCLAGCPKTQTILKYC